MNDFDSDVPTMKWEFGYWGETINRWYREGLPKKNPPELPDEITTPTSSLYIPAWNCDNKYVDQGEYPQGIAITAGGLYTPTQGFPLDNDVRDFTDMDRSQRLVDLNLLFYPTFEPETIRETEDKLIYRDIDGVSRTFLKESATLPSWRESPVKGWDSWEKLKEERMNLDHVKDRLPDNWEGKVEEYGDRDYPLGLGGYPQGFFGTLAHLLGYENLFKWYYRKPELIHDMLDRLTDLWIAVFEEVLKDVDIDHAQIWEDISYGTGSMVSPKMIEEFMVPYYKRLTGFLKEHGVEHIFVDTDGDCMDIIPLFIEGGVTGMLPFEVSAGMDVVEARKKFPDLAMMGGIPKSEIPKGKERIDEILEPVEYLLDEGGYIPFGDHLIPPDVPWEDFRYYREKLNQLIDSA
jgi:uroporphyrinogen decarboxylase